MRIKWQILKIYDSLMSAWHIHEYCLMTAWRDNLKTTEFSLNWRQTKLRQKLRDYEAARSSAKPKNLQILKKITKDRGSYYVSIQNAKSILSSLNLCEQWVGSAIWLSCPVIGICWFVYILISRHQFITSDKISSHKCHKCYHWLGQ